MPFHLGWKARISSGFSFLFEVEVSGSGSNHGIGSSRAMVSFWTGCLCPRSRTLLCPAGTSLSPLYRCRRRLNQSCGTGRRASSPKKKGSRRRGGARRGAAGRGAIRLSYSAIAAITGGGAGRAEEGARFATPPPLPPRRRGAAIAGGGAGRGGGGAAGAARCHLTDPPPSPYFPAPAPLPHPLAGGAANPP